MDVKEIILQEKREIAFNIKRAKACQMKDEIILHDQEKQKLYSVDLDDWNLEEINLQLFQITMTHFHCIEYDRRAFILNAASKTTSEIVVLLSGKQHDIYNRIKSRIPVAAAGIIDLQAYKVHEDYIFATTNETFQYTYQKYIQIDSRVRTQLSENTPVGKYTA